MIQGYMLELLPVNFAPSHNAVPNAVPFFFLQGMRTLGHVLECSSPRRRRYLTPGGGGVLDISLGGEVRRGPSYPDPV